MPSDNVISWDLRVDGASASQQRVNTVAQSFTSLDEKTRQTTQRFTGVASAGSALGTALSRLDPQIGSIVAAFGSAGGAASGLTAAMGGVGGLVGGGLVAALSVAIQYFVNTKTETDKLTQSYEKQIESVEELIASYRELEKVKAAESRAAFGVETVADLERKAAFKHQELQEARDYLSVLSKTSTEEKIANADAIGSLTNKVIRLEQEEASLTRQLESRRQIKVQEDIEEVATDDLSRMIDEQNRLREKGVALAKQAAAEAERKRLEEERSFELLMTSPTDKLGEQLIAESEERERIELESMEKGFDREQQFYDRKMALMEQFIREAEAKEKTHQAKMQAIGIGYLNTVSSTMASTLSDLVKGRKIAAAAIIETIGDQMVAKGTQHLLEGLAMQFIPFMQGNATGLMTVGAAEIATGLTMGAAGSAAQPSRGGGGGGGVMSSSPASPSPREQPQQTSDEMPPVVINVHTLRADEDAGRAIHESLESYRNRHGKSASLGRFV